MMFEDIVIRNPASMEEYREIVEPALSDRGVREGRMKDLAKRLFQVDELPEMSREERERRGRASRAMREKMRTFLYDNYEAKKRRDGSIYRQVSRAIGSDFLLNLPHPEQDGIFEERSRILRSGTPQEKSRLFFEAFEDLTGDLTREKLMNMTDEEIAEDFDRLSMITSVLGSTENYLDKPDLPMTQEQRQMFLNRARELWGPAITVFNRAKLIATPGYEYIPWERLPIQDSVIVADRIDSDMMTGSISEEEREALKTVTRDLGSLQMTAVSNAIMDDITIRELNGVPSEEITWLDAKGRSLGEHRGKPPAWEMIEGKGQPITAVFPDGSEKLFAPTQRNGITAYAVYDRLTYLDKSTQQALPDLVKGLDKADPLLVRSSKEYKNVQAQVEKLQKEWKKLGPNPTQYQRDKMGQQMEALAASANAYLNKKLAGKDVDDPDSLEGLNDLEKKRVAAVKSVKDFAEQQLSSLGLLKAQLERKNSAPEKEAFTRSQAAREENQERMGEQIRQEQAKERRGAYTRELGWDSLSALEAGGKCRELSEHGKELLQLVNERYPEQPNHPDSPLNDLRSMILERVEIMDRSGSGEVKDRESFRAMTLMTSYDLIAQEQVGREAAGPMEQLCQKSVKSLFSAVSESRALQEMMSEEDAYIDTEEFPNIQVENFLMRNDGRSLAGQILSKAKAPERQQPAQPRPAQPQRSRQNPQGPVIGGGKK